MGKYFCLEVFFLFGVIYISQVFGAKPSVSQYCYTYGSLDERKASPFNSYDGFDTDCACIDFNAGELQGFFGLTGYYSGILDIDTRIATMSFENYSGRTGNATVLFSSDFLTVTGTYQYEGHDHMYVWISEAGILSNKSDSSYDPQVKCFWHNVYSDNTTNLAGYWTIGSGIYRQDTYFCLDSDNTSSSSDSIPTQGSYFFIYPSDYPDAYARNQSEIGLIQGVSTIGGRHFFGSFYAISGPYRHEHGRAFYFMGFADGKVRGYSYELDIDLFIVQPFYEEYILEVPGNDFSACRNHPLSRVSEIKMHISENDGRLLGDYSGNSDDYLCLNLNDKLSSFNEIHGVFGHGAYYAGTVDMTTRTANLSIWNHLGENGTAYVYFDSDWLSAVGSFRYESWPDEMTKDWISESGVLFNFSSVGYNWKEDCLWNSDLNDGLLEGYWVAKDYELPAYNSDQFVCVDKSDNCVDNCPVYGSFFYNFNPNGRGWSQSGNLVGTTFEGTKSFFGKEHVESGYDADSINSALFITDFEDSAIRGYSYNIDFDGLIESWTFREFFQEESGNIVSACDINPRSQISELRMIFGDGDMRSAGTYGGSSTDYACINLNDISRSNVIQGTFGLSTFYRGTVDMKTKDATLHLWNYNMEKGSATITFSEDWLSAAGTYRFFSWPSETYAQWNSTLGYRREYLDDGYNPKLNCLWNNNDMNLGALEGYYRHHMIKDDMYICVDGYNDENPVSGSYYIIYPVEAPALLRGKSEFGVLSGITFDRYHFHALLVESDFNDNPFTSKKKSVLFISDFEENKLRGYYYIFDDNNVISSVFYQEFALVIPGNLPEECSCNPLSLPSQIEMVFGSNDERMDGFYVGSNADYACLNFNDVDKNIVIQGTFGRYAFYSGYVELYTKMAVVTVWTADGFSGTANLIFSSNFRSVQGSYTDVKRSNGVKVWHGVNGTQVTKGMNGYDPKKYCLWNNVATSYGMEGNWTKAEHGKISNMFICSDEPYVRGSFLLNNSISSWNTGLYDGDIGQISGSVFIHSHGAYGTWNVLDGPSKGQMGGFLVISTTLNSIHGFFVQYEEYSIISSREILFDRKNNGDYLDHCQQYGTTSTQFSLAMCIKPFKLAFLFYCILLSVFHFK